MKAKIILGIVVIGLGLLALSNPGMEDFKQAAEEEMKKQLQERTQLEQAIGNLFGGTLSEMLASRTVRTNYFFCSIFSFEFDHEEYRYIGIAGTFIPLQQELPFNDESAI